MRRYVSALMDNARWEGLVPRPDDIFVCTAGKCGTTWMQMIVASLLWPDGDFPGPIVNGISPWIDAKFMPAKAMHELLDAQTHRRAMKTHTPADGIPWFPQAKYISVARDGRDAFMSWCNHMARMKATDALNAAAERDGLPALQRFDGDYREYFREWLREHRFFDVVASYWTRRHEPNLLLLHYNDLKADLAGEMRRVAQFLAIDIAEPKWPAVVERCTFEAMRAADTPVGSFNGFDGGVQGFIFKGTNGRWRDVLGPDELAAYDAEVRGAFEPECARWVEKGGSSQLSVGR